MATGRVGLVSLSLLLSQLPSAQAQHFNFYVMPGLCIPSTCRAKCQALGYEDLASLSTPEAYTYALELMEPILAKCQALGYEDLASLGTPEAYTYALELIEPILSDGGRVSIGLYYEQREERIEWADGTLPTPDTPWLRNLSTISKNQQWGRIAHGKIIMVGGTRKRNGMCGNRSYVRDVQGKSYHGQQLVHQDAALQTTKAPSYLKCVTFCGQDSACRAAEFERDALSCTTHGPGLHDKMVPRVSTSTFKRLNYPAPET
ncbi:hypothetical protein EGW08_013021 [Elysia chlorotica]|uniref:Apple domain-containing protein n=1 Tax=Elysia chlorotica TaxID=188477 RepID=A0A3S0ZNS9_ELYCH|nr:hypothetical protein EGW08_013021 [Elysia chlorotica]